MREQQTITAYDPSCAACRFAVVAFKKEDDGYHGDFAFCAEHGPEYFELTNPAYVEDNAGVPQAVVVPVPVPTPVDNTAAEYKALLEEFNALYVPMVQNEKWKKQAMAVRLSKLGVEPNIVKLAGSISTPLLLAEDGQPVPREYFDDLRIGIRVMENTRP